MVSFYSTSYKTQLNSNILKQINPRCIGIKILFYLQIFTGNIKKEEVALPISCYKGVLHKHFSNILFWGNQMFVFLWRFEYLLIDNQKMYLFWNFRWSKSCTFYVFVDVTCEVSFLLSVIWFLSRKNIRMCFFFLSKDVLFVTK